MNPLNRGLSRQHFRARFAIIFFLVFLQAAPLTAVQPPKPTPEEEKKPQPEAKNDLDKLRVKELIDKLQDVSDHAAWGIDFIASDEQLQFRKAIHGPHKPKTSPAMKELVRRGVAALPELIDHLNDKRPTKLIIDYKTYGMSMWHSDEYDPRYSDPTKKPGGVNTDLKNYEGFEKQGFGSKYTFRVGDLCLVAIGQIVNRGLWAVRSQPTACTVINSPVQTPSLAAAVKKDWTGLTVEQHKQSLSQDALSKYPYATSRALERLLFYYPKDGDALALKLLGRPLYDDSVMWDFIRERLVKEDDPARWKTLIDEFRSKHGRAAADSLPFWLHWIYWMTDFERNKEFLEGKDRASKILARLYPDFDPYKLSFINAATAEERFLVIDNLVTYRGHDKEFRDLLASRIKALEDLPKDSDERRFLEALYFLRDQLKKP
jgi:hypothetical protein